MSSYCEAPAARTDWETPQWLFDALDKEFGFTCDVCATDANAKCLDYFSPGVDGLKMPWNGTCWMNPPYGPEISAWIEKAHKTAKDGYATVVCLLPARSSNEWWKYVIDGEVRFVRKKVQFVGAPYNSMFPNVIVVFRRGLEGGGRMSIWRRP